MHQGRKHLPQVLDQHRACAAELQQACLFPTLTMFGSGRCTLARVDQAAPQFLPFACALRQPGSNMHPCSELTTELALASNPLSLTVCEESSV